MQEQTVKLIECPRDAWQGLPRQIPTELKVRYLRALIEAGFRHMDAVSFVSPKAVPQMADSDAVLAQLAPPNDVEIIGIAVNEKGAERAIATGRVTTLGYPFSISPTFLRRNQNQSPEENIGILKRVVALSKEARLGTVAYISMAFGNPYGDAWSADSVAEAAQMLQASGVDAISLADTVGTAGPELLSAVVSRVRVDCELGVHLHSTRAGAAEKVLAAYDAGCRRFDAALGGLGGCPFAQDNLVGNVPTEAVCKALEQRGIEFAVEAALRPLLEMTARIGSEFATE
jgi:hydroxymethylglutaryl-CoA lyase